MSETGWKQSLLQPISEGWETLSERYPRGYLLVATALALVGYGWLLLFPWLVLAGLSGGSEALTGEPAVAWGDLLTWSAVTAGAALVTYRIAQFRPDLPSGSAVDREMAPQLFDLVGELVRHYGRPGIDRIVITDAFELEVVKTPRWALPVWSVNTLVIGLPLIQSLSPVQFRCALARRLGQYSKRYNTVQNWLCQLRRVWPLYSRATDAPAPGLEPIRWFFSVFAPLYDWASLPAARLDELAADTCAMEVCSDQEVLDAITTEAVCRLYLEEKYWPAFRRLSASVREAMPKAHVGMASVLRAGLKGTPGQQWLANAMDREARWDEPMPSLARRVDNIGYLNTELGEMATESAAVVYLGSAAEALEKMLGRASPQTSSRPGKPHPFRFDPRAFRGWLIGLARGRQAHSGASTVDKHRQIPSPQ
jgi:hypothetical protein